MTTSTHSQIICPLWSIAQEHPQYPFLIGKDAHTFEMVERHTQQKTQWLQSTFDSHLESNPQCIPKIKLGVAGADPLEVITWLMAAARSQMVIAICSNKDPLPKLRSHLKDHNILWLDDLLTEHPLEKIPVMAQNPILDPPLIQKDLPLCILFTSGSSGSPKAVVHSFGNYWSSAAGSFANIPFTHPDKWLLSLSLWHIGGLAILFRALYGRASVILKDPSISIGDQIQRDQCTHLSIVSTQLGDLLDHQGSFTSLKAILVGGGMIHSQYLDLATERKWPIHTTYGMTELSSQMCTTKPHSQRAILHSAGSPLGDWNIQIGDHDEILCKGSSLFLGYWNGEDIISAKDDQGYFHTGDRGRIIGDLLYIIGRCDQMFISGGENIHPEEIEGLLMHIFAQAIVVPIPNQRYGQRPVAFVYPKEDHPIEKEKILLYLQDHLPKFKHPDHFLPWPKDIPIIKPPRGTLQKMAIECLSKHL